MEQWSEEQGMNEEQDIYASAWRVLHTSNKEEVLVFCKGAEQFGSEQKIKGPTPDLTLYNTLRSEVEDLLEVYKEYKMKLKPNFLSIVALRLQHG